MNSANCPQYVPHRHSTSIGQMWSELDANSGHKEETRRSLSLRSPVGSRKFELINKLSRFSVLTRILRTRYSTANKRCFCCGSLSDGIGTLHLGQETRLVRLPPSPAGNGLVVGRQGPSLSSRWMAIKRFARFHTKPTRPSVRLHLPSSSSATSIRLGVTSENYESFVAFAPVLGRDDEFYSTSANRQPSQSIIAQHGRCVPGWGPKPFIILPC